MVQIGAMQSATRRRLSLLPKAINGSAGRLTISNQNALFIIRTVANSSESEPSRAPGLKVDIQSRFGKT